LKENCSIDISNDVEFTSSKDVFRAVLIGLKKKGYAGTDHKPVNVISSFVRKEAKNNLSCSFSLCFGNLSKAESSPRKLRKLSTLRAMHLFVDFESFSSTVNVRDEIT
jgi:hypothetical protein